MIAGKTCILDQSLCSPDVSAARDHINVDTQKLTILAAATSIPKPVDRTGYTV